MDACKGTKNDNAEGEIAHAPSRSAVFSVLMSLKLNFCTGLHFVFVVVLMVVWFTIMTSSYVKHVRHKLIFMVPLMVTFTPCALPLTRSLDSTLGESERGGKMGEEGWRRVSDCRELTSVNGRVNVFGV